MIAFARDHIEQFFAVWMAVQRIMLARINRHSAERLLRPGHLHHPYEPGNMAPTEIMRVFIARHASRHIVRAQLPELLSNTSRSTSIINVDHKNTIDASLP